MAVSVRAEGREFQQNDEVFFHEDGESSSAVMIDVSDGPKQKIHLRCDGVVHKNVEHGKVDGCWSGQAVVTKKRK